MHILPGPTKSNRVLAWSPDGRFLVAGGNGDGVMVWDVNAGTPGQQIIRNAHGGEELRFCPVSGRLYIAFRSGGVWTFDPHIGEQRQRLPDNRAQYACPSVADNGQTVVFRRWIFDRIVSSVGYAVVGCSVANDGTLSEIWVRRENEGTNTVRNFNFTFRPRTDQLFGLRREFNGIANFEWMTAETGELRGSFPLAGPVARWVLSKDGERVAWLTTEGLFSRRLDDPTVQQLPTGKGEIRRGLALSPNGEILAYTSNKTVRLVEASTFNEIRTLDWNTGIARAVAFSPDGLRCAVSGEGGRGWVTVFDVE